MAYYKLNKTIRMKRTILGKTRDDFDVDGPTGMTLYRIEKDLNRVTERTYRNLTKAMWLEESLKQGVLGVGNLELLQMINDISRANLIEDYEKARKLLDRLEEQVETTEVRNRQYIENERAYYNYKEKLISAEEYEQKIMEILSWSVPNFKKGFVQGWPYLDLEWGMLLSLNTTLRAQKKYIEEKELLEKIIENLEIGYVNYEFTAKYRIALLFGLADVYGNLGLHRQAIKIDKKVIEYCHLDNNYVYLSKAHYDIHWNYWKIKEKETLSRDEENESRQSLLIAYSFCEVQGKSKKLYIDTIKERYPNEINNWID